MRVLIHVVADSLWLGADMQTDTRSQAKDSFHGITTYTHRTASA
jgi:hypothetical protein